MTDPENTEHTIPPSNRESSSHQKALEKLLEISEDFLKNPADEINFQKITDNLLSLTRAQYVVFNLYEEDGQSFRTKAISGHVSAIREALKILGFKILDKKWPHNPVRAEKIKYSNITRFDSITELTDSIIPASMTRQLTKTFNLGQSVIIKISTNNLLLGDFTIIMPANQEFICDEVAAIYSRQVGMVITRYRAELQRKQAEKELEDERNFAIQVMDSLGQGLTIIDENGTFRYVNPAYASLIGYDTQELIGKKPEDLTDSPDLKTMLGEFKKRAKGQTSSYENFLIHKKGHRVPVLITGVPVMRGKKFKGTIGAITDLSELKKKEHTIERQKQQLRQIIDLVPNYIFAKDSEGGFIMANKAVADVFGLDPEDVSGKKDNDYGVSHQQNVQYDKDDLKVLESGKPLFIPEEQILRKDGSMGWFQTVKIPYKHPGISKPAILGVATDITERKKAEEKIRQSETRYRSLFEQTNDAIFILNMEGTNIDANSRAVELFGYTKQELVGMTPHNFSLELDKSLLVVRKLLKGEDIPPYERLFRKKDGSIFPVEVNVKLIRDEKGKPVYIQSVVRDITWRREAEKALRESEEKYRSLVDQSMEMMFLHDTRGNLVDVNKAACKQTGYTHGELINLNVFDLHVSAENKKQMIEKWINMPKGKPLTIEKQYKTKKGYIYPVEINTGKIQIGENEYILALVRDITLRKRTEEALREREKLLHSMIQSQKEMISRFLPDTTLTFVNDAYCRYFQKSREDLLNKKWIEILIPASKQQAIRQHFESFAQSGKEHITYEHSTIVPDGRKKWEIWTDYAFRNEEGRIIGFQSVGTDISHTKEKEKLEKEMAVTRNTLTFKQNLITAMSHEVRTPLTAVMGTVDLLETTSLSKKQKEFVNNLSVASHNLNEIYNQVLDYSRIEEGKVKISKNYFPLTQIVSEAQKLFSKTCTKPVKLNTRIEKSLPETVETDQARVIQVTQNLLSNAVKHTDKGEISLILEKLPHPESLFVKVTISDTGKGIEESQKSTIFEPFSEISKIDTEKYSGLGLGLNISKKIVELLEGEIGFDSTPGKGSTFWFTFKCGKSQPQTPSPDHSLVKGLNILFADDKAVTQKVIKLQLSGLGHSVSLASDGKEVLEFFKPNTFDLILMDIQMPVMDGITATQVLRKRYKDLPPVVGLSANAFDGAREKYMTMGLDEYISKPLQINELKTLIEKIFRDKQ